MMWGTSKAVLRKWVLPLAFWLVAWALVSYSINKELLLPTPVAVMESLVYLAGTAAFWQTLCTTLLRIFLGAAVGILLGTVLAVLTSYIPLMDHIFSPVIRMLRATPVASFIILVLLWTASGRVPGVISAITVLPLLWENVSSGLASVDDALLEAAEAYGFGPIKKLHFVRWPAVRPHLAAGISNAIGLAWKSGVAAEVLCVPHHAIGTEIYHAKLYLETPTLFAWTGMVVLLSLLIEWLVRWLLKGGRQA